MRLGPRRTGWRSVLLPSPLRLIGWIPTVLYYMYGAGAVLYVATALVTLFTEGWEVAFAMLLACGISLLIAAPSWYWALKNWDQNFARRQSMA